jgi:hypothetical protein
MALWEYLLLGISTLCILLAGFSAIMEFVYPHENCINSHLKDKKIEPQTIQKGNLSLKVEGPQSVIKNYPLTEKSFKACFSRTMNQNQIEVLYRIWKIKPFHLSFRYTLKENNIGRKWVEGDHIFIEILFNLKATEMYDTILYLLEPNPAKKPIIPPISPAPKIEFNSPIAKFPIIHLNTPLSKQLITQKTKGDKTLLLLNEEFPLNEYNLRLVLKEYVPSKGIDYCVNLWLQDPFHLQIVKDFDGGKDTFGTFCTMKGKRKNVICILESLAPNTFFWTFIHEFSHLVAYRKTGQVAHCATFYRCFKKLGLPILDMGIFPKAINEHLHEFFQKPNRFSALNRWGNAA